MSAYALTAAVSAVTTILGALTGILLARWLGPEGRGVHAILNYYAGLLGMVFCFAIPQVIIKWLGEPHRQNVVKLGVHLAAILALAGALFFSTLAPSTLPPDKTALSPALALVCLLSVGMVSSPLLEAILLGKGYFTHVNIVRVLAAISAVGALWVLSLIGWLGALSATIAVLLIQLVVSLAHLARLDVREWLQAPDFNGIKELLRDALSFAIPVAAAGVLTFADRFSIVALATSPEVGLYAVGMALAVPFLTLGSSLAQLLFAEITAASLVNARAILAMRLPLIFWTSVLGCALVLPLVPWVIRLLFGSDFSDGTFGAQILICGLGLRGFCLSIDYALRAQGRTGTPALCSVIAAAVVAGLSVAAFPKLGWPAIPLAVLVGSIAHLLMLGFAFRHQYSIMLPMSFKTVVEFARSKWSRALAALRLSLEGARTSVFDGKRAVRRLVPSDLRKRINSTLNRVLIRSFGLNPTNIIRKLTAQTEAAGLNDLRAELTERAPESDGAGAHKYCDVASWCETALMEAAMLGLHERKGLNILDIGSGPCHFLAIARELGHRGVGMDLPLNDLPLSERLVYAFFRSAYAIELVEHRIKPFSALPLNESFDVITCFLICFNNHRGGREWGVSEWADFIREALSHLRPGGFLYLQLNAHPELYGALTFFDPETEALLRQSGAVSRGRVLIRKVEEN